MELREVIKVFKENRRLFFGIVVAFLFVGVGVFFFQPQAYSSNLMLNVTRSGIQETQEYRYDEFYRLQADERFADTIVRWLGSPQITEDIYEKSGIVSKKTIKARRLSSQMIEVIFVLKNKDDAEKISVAALEVLNGQIEILNRKQESETWFMLVASEPFVMEKKLGPIIVFAAALLLGLFFGAWGVMISHYFKK